MTNHGSFRTVRSLPRLTSMAFAATVGLCGFANAEPSTLGDTNAPITPSMLDARQAKHNSTLNMLTYQHMDKLFGAQAVQAKAPAALPTNSSAEFEDFSYSVEGNGYSIDEALELFRVNSIVVLHDGEIAYENYRNGTDESTQSITYSASKSVNAILVGIALENGIIDSLDDPVDKYLQELSESAYSGVPIKNLMTMQSGTDWKESYEPGSQLYIHRNRSLNVQEVYYEDYALEISKAIEPGTEFNYSTLDTQVVGWLLESALDGTFSEYMSDVLWTPAGMETDAYWVEQGPVDSPRPFYGAGLAASTRDMTRIGQLMLNGGEINGKRIVSEDWVKKISTPQGGSRFYGYFWWLSEDGTYDARGINGQWVHVDPNTNTVIATNSYWPSSSWREMRDAWTGFLMKVSSTAAE